MTEKVCGFWYYFRILVCGHVPASHLAADAEVRVGDELGLLVAVVLHLQESVQHTHAHTGQSHQEGQQLPGLC